MECETEGNESKIGSPWGSWASLGIIILSLALFTGINIVVFQGFVSYADHRSLSGSIEQFITNNYGLIFIAGSLFSHPLCILLIVLFSSLRRGYPLREYLALVQPPGKESARWFIACLIYVLCSDALTTSLHRPVVNDFMVKAYTTSHSIPLYFLVLVLTAPLFEELLFRGFMYQWLVHTRLGYAGTIVLTSLAWAVIHLQYDLYEISSIFVFGLLLGYARRCTGSLYVTCAMHSTANLVAFIESAVYIHFFTS